MNIPFTSLLFNSIHFKLVSVLTVKFVLLRYSRTSVVSTLMALLHSYFKHNLESLTKYPTAADIIVFGMIFFFYIDDGVLCALIKIMSMRRF